jgi:hypothetical protein
VLFSTLSIASLSISQASDVGLWGGSQGDVAVVTATIAFSDGRQPITFPDSINWVKTSGQGFDWVGLTIGASQIVNDGYSPRLGAQKTYIL